MSQQDAAAGLLADSPWQLARARDDLEHLLVWHFGATVAMTFLGAASGSFWRRRDSRLREGPRRRKGRRPGFHRR